METLQNALSFNSYVTQVREDASAASGLPSAVGQLLPIALNDNHLQDNYSNPALTNYAVGGGSSDNQALRQLLEFLAPSTPAPRRFSYGITDRKDWFEKAPEDRKRGYKNNFAIIHLKGSRADGSTVNKGLCLCNDVDEMQPREGRFDFQTEQGAVDRIMRRLLLSELVDVVNALSSNTTNVAWDPATQNPASYFEEQMDLFEDTNCLEANRVAIGKKLWRKIKDYYRDPANKCCIPNLTKAEFADMVGVRPEHFVCDNTMCIDTTEIGKKKIVPGNTAWIYRAEANAGIEDPTSIKRFVSSTNQGGEFASYQHSEMKLHYTTVEHYSNVIRTTDDKVIAISCP